MISFSGKLWLVEKFARGHPEWGRFMRLHGVHGYELAIWRFFYQSNKPPYLRNRSRYDQSYYWTLIGNCIIALNWYQNQWPWMALNWPWTAIMRFLYITRPMSFGFGATLATYHKIWIKIDPYHQRQKCKPRIHVSSKIRFMRIFVGVPWTADVKWEWGRFFSANFDRYVTIFRKWCILDTKLL